MMRILAATYAVLPTAFARADVFNMSPGLTNLETVPVGRLGNTSDDTGFGAVSYEYWISKYEVTAGQYCEFLNAVARTDAYGLYDANMATDASGCKIQRGGTADDYTYSVQPEWANRPVNYVSWGDAARFCNWLQNGQLVGAQDDNTTEDGAYHLVGATSDEALLAVSRAPNAMWVIPNEDEWYKAAYHKNDGDTANYFDYPTSSDYIDVGMANYGWSVGCTTVVGAYGVSSPYGTFDQGGNVWEWNEARLYEQGRGVRGGALREAGGYLLASGQYRNAPTVAYNQLGFRVARARDPSARAGSDYDADGDVDLTDFGFFLACFNGPNRPYPNLTGCDHTDYDGDSDVDLADFGTFLACFNGPERPPACAE